MCVARFGSASDSGGRLRVGLERVGSNLSFSPSESVVEGGTPGGVIHRERSPDSTELVHSGVVSPSVEEVPVPSSSPKLSLSQIVGDRRIFASSARTNHLHYWVLGFHGSFSSSNAEVLLKTLRASATHQYKSIWSTFSSYAKDHHPSCVDDSFVLSFLRFLFFDKNLTPSAINSYRFALVRPLQYASQLDLSAPF